MKAIHHIILGLCLLAFSTATIAQDTLAGHRLAWQWPFSQNSIWNMPIGSEATYESAHFQPAAHVGVDIQHILELNANDPRKIVLGTEVWGEGRCNGTQSLGFLIQIADDYIVPDAGNSPYGLTPNGNFAFRLPNSNLVFEGSQLSRCTVGGPVHLPIWMQYPNNRKYQSIKENGLKGGGQGASSMSALGGTIRLGELTNEAPIRHAIKINPWAKKYCYYHDTLPGFKWPAKSADNYAKGTYGGTNPHILMGSLFAIPPDIAIDDLNLQTVAGKKLFFTMQNYGVYFTEDAAWDTWDIIVERDAELEFKDKYGFSMTSTTWKNELNKLMQALSIVVNNAPERIGGGGIPRQPYAPPFDELTTTITLPEEETVEVYPNPLIGEQLHFNRIISVEVFNIDGQFVGSFHNVSTISLQLKAGVYILKMLERENVLVKKLIKVE